MYYKFQESLIWEAGNPVDENRTPVKIKARSEERARRKLPSPGGGRVWVLIGTN